MTGLKNVSGAVEKGKGRVGEEGGNGEKGEKKENVEGMENGGMGRRK